MSAVKLACLISFLCSLFLFGCSLDYSEAFLTDDLDEEIPDSILFEFSHTAVRKGTPAFRLQADYAAIFDKKKETHLTGVLFQEFDRHGNVITEGKADSAIFFTETENAELVGDLKVHSLSEEVIVSTGYLYWNDQDRTLTGAEDQTVVVIKDDGSELVGEGFFAEIATKSVTFYGSVSGKYITDDEK